MWDWREGRQFKCEFLTGESLMPSMIGCMCYFVYFFIYFLQLEITVQHGLVLG